MIDDGMTHACMHVLSMRVLGVYLNTSTLLLFIYLLLLSFYLLLALTSTTTRLKKCKKEGKLESAEITSEIFILYHHFLHCPTMMSWRETNSRFII